METTKSPFIPVRFYSTGSGRELVVEWLRSIDAKDRQAIGRDLMRAQYRWPVGMPLARSLKGGLWEVRTSLPSGNIARLMVCFHDQTLVVLHGFIKKTQKTPAGELEIARQRLKETVG